MRDDLDVPMFLRRVRESREDDRGDDYEALKICLVCRLHRDLIDPVRVDRRRRHRITVMSGIQVVVNRRRREIVARGRQSANPEDWLQARLALDRPLSGPYWARAWWWCIRAELEPHLRALGDTMLDSELPALINREARRSGLLRAARRRVIASLRLNARLLAWAWALSRDGTPDSTHYRAIWRDVRRAKRHTRESPRLWPLYDVTRVPLRSDLDTVKRILVQNGLTRGGWKVLCRHGRALWWPIRRCHEFKRDPKREVIALANLVAATGRDGLPLPALLLAVGRLSSINRFPASEAGKLMLPFREAWNDTEVIDPDKCLAWVRGPVDAVFTEWLLRSKLPPVPRGAGWGWFERWAERSRRAASDQRIRWPWFGSQTWIGSVEIAPLRNLREVREAGLAMRNCMGHADERDGRVERAFFVMRDGQGRAVAMFSAYAGDGASGIVEIRGRYNRQPDRHLRAIACRYLDAHRKCKLRNAPKAATGFVCGTPFLRGFRD